MNRPGIQTSSGTYATFSSFLGGDPNVCVVATGGQLLFENDCTPINNLPAADRGRSIWWLSFGKYSSGNTNCTDAATDLISVNGVAPSTTAIQDNSYQYNNTLYNVYRRNDRPWVRDYIAEHGWICKPNALHSKPIGDPGAGIANPLVDRNWGLTIDKAITDAGFVKVNPVGNKCFIFDVN